MKKKPPIVLQVLPSMNQGGVEHATFDTAHAIAKAFPDVTNYVASSGGCLVSSLPPQTTHITLPLYSKHPITIFENALRLRKIIKSHNITVVHGRSRAPAWSALIAARLTRTPFITTYHAAYKSNHFFKKLYNSVMARGDVVITISKFIDTLLTKNYPQAKKSLIVEGIDTEYFSSSASFEEIKKSTLFKMQHPILFIPSRQSKIKGIEVAIHTLKQLLQSGKKANLLLIKTGKENYISHIKKLISELDLTSHITWIPAQLDLRPYYAACDIVLVPSLAEEALGRVNIEALAMEKTLISTNVGATPESCIHQKTGFLINSDDIHDLAEKITTVLDMPSLSLANIKKAGRAHVLKNFNINHTMKKTIELYCQIS